MKSKTQFLNFELPTDSAVTGHILLLTYLLFDYNDRRCSTQMAMQQPSRDMLQFISISFIKLQTRSSPSWHSHNLD